MNDSPPIIVPASTTPAVVLTVVRYVLTAGGMYLLVDNKLMDNEQLQNLVGSIMMVVPGLWGALLSRRDVHKQQVMESHLPNNVAHRK